MSEEDLDARELLLALRGVPSKCDFCGEATEADKLEPEEGGDWVCWKCLDRWNAKEKEPNA